MSDQNKRTSELIAEGLALLHGERPSIAAELLVQSAQSRHLTAAVTCVPLDRLPELLVQIIRAKHGRGGLDRFVQALEIEARQ